MMEELHKIWGSDRRKYIDEVRRFTQELENVFVSDKDHSLHESDHAWDVESRREEIREMYGSGEKADENPGHDHKKDPGPDNGADPGPEPDPDPDPDPDPETPGNR